MERFGNGRTACLHRRFLSRFSPSSATAWRRKGAPFVAPTLWTIAALFVVQVVLGAETVRLANVPISVVLHWGTAMALIAALSAMAVFAAASERTPVSPGGADAQILPRSESRPLRHF